MSERVFVDTSVLLNAHNLDAGVKRSIAEHVLRQLWHDRTGVLSSQVLQEFYAALTAAASPVPRRAARDVVGAYRVWPSVTLDTDDVLTASDFEERYRLSLRDALVVAAARKAHATLLLAERLTPFRPIAGLEVRDPFS